jgi:hypothetical protein
MRGNARVWTLRMVMVALYFRDVLHTRDNLLQTPQCCRRLSANNMAGCTANDEHGGSAGWQQSNLGSEIRLRHLEKSSSPHRADQGADMHRALTDADPEVHSTLTKTLTLASTADFSM